MHPRNPEGTKTDPGGGPLGGVGQFDPRTIRRLHTYVSDPQKELFPFLQTNGIILYVSPYSLLFSFQNSFFFLI